MAKSTGWDTIAGIHRLTVDKEFCFAEKLMILDRELDDLE